MGIEGIAAEVENPFGTDQNDLPLDLELAELRVEIEYIFSRLVSLLASSFFACYPPLILPFVFS